MIDVAHPRGRRQLRPFNSPLECGLRTLFILDSSRNVGMDLQRIVAYDYLLVHSGDIENGPESLHPAVPYRGAELLIKRDSIQAGLNQLLAKELIQINFVPQGFVYTATELTGAFVKLLKSSYAIELQKRSRWVAAHFGAFTDRKLDYYITANIGRWGAEFEALAAIDSLEL
jgi:hypothetical protein